MVNVAMWNRLIIVSVVVLSSLMVAPLTTAQEGTFPRITAENATQLAWQRSIGLGALTNATWSADGKTLFTVTRSGVYRYDSFGSAPTLVSGTFISTINATFSSNGRWLATVIEYGSKVRISNLETGEFWMAVEEPESGWKQLYFMGDTLVALSQSNRVWLYDVGQKRVLQKIDDVVEVAVHPNGEQFAIQDRYGLSLWDLATQREIGRFAGLHERSIRMQFSGDGKTLYTVQVSKGIHAYDVERLQPKYHLPVAVAGFVRYDAQAKVAVTWGYESSSINLQPVDLEHGQLLAAVQVSDTKPAKAVAVVDVALIADGTRFATFSWDNRLRVWDTTTGRMLAERITETADFLSFKPDSTEIVFGSPSGLMSYDYASDQLKSITGDYGLNVGHIEFSPDGRWLAAVGESNTIRFWEVGAWDTHYELRLPITHAAARTYHFSFSPDSRYMLIGSNLQIWRYDVSQVGRTKPTDDALLFLAKETCASTAFSGNSKYMACALNKSVLIWDTVSGKLVWDYAKAAPQEDLIVTHLAFASDSTKLVVSMGLDRIDVVSIPDFRVTQHPVNSEEVQFALTFSPDSNLLALTTSDNIFYVYDAETWQTVWSVNGLYRDNMYRTIAPRRFMEFSPDGSLLATGDMVQQVRLYNPTTGELIFDLKPNASGEGLYDIRGISFSPDGTLLAGSTETGLLMLWSIPIAE